MNLIFNVQSSIIFLTFLDAYGHLSSNQAIELHVCGSLALREKGWLDISHQVKLKVNKGQG